jgi:phosphate/sulfate permease
VELGMHHVLMIIGFMLAAYAIVANDAIQTLGTFLSSNAHRPWWLLWLFASGVLTVVFVYSWVVYDGDIAYGRLEKFPMPEVFTWALILPPIVVLILTRFGIPVSTTFLILTSFAATQLSGMLIKSLLGYAIAFAAGMVIYMLISRIFYRRFLTGGKPPGYWVALQWISTAFLWSQWLVQDLANIFAYLPRQLDTATLLFALVVMLALHAALFYRRGGAIQGIVNSKTNTQDIRSATIIDVIFALILIYFKEMSNVPMSTTWVFLGLLAGRELALVIMLKVAEMGATARVIANDAGKAIAGLLVSVAIATAMPVIVDWTGGYKEQHASLDAPAAASEKK